MSRAPVPRLDDEVTALLASYVPPDGAADELLRPDGSLRPVWEPLLSLLAEESPDGLGNRFARGAASNQAGKRPWRFLLHMTEEQVGTTDT